MDPKKPKTPKDWKDYAAKLNQGRSNGSGAPARPGAPLTGHGHPAISRAAMARATLSSDRRASVPLPPPPKGWDEKTEIVRLQEENETLKTELRRAACGLCFGAGKKHEVGEAADHDCEVLECSPCERCKGSGKALIPLRSATKVEG